MILFIFDKVLDLTHRFHSSGGLVVIAENEETAKQMIENHKDINCVSEDDWFYVKKLKLSDEEAPNIWVFPNAGCC